MEISHSRLYDDLPSSILLEVRCPSESTTMKIRLIFATIIMMTLICREVSANDWPMWRFDASRSAASPEALPDQLQLQWQRQFAPRVQAWDDPLNLDLMTYDRSFEPIVIDGRMFVGFNDRDKLVALDAATGEELWSFFTDGPLRLAPAGWQDCVCFCSDDGYLYCVEAATGALKWKFRGAPGSQKAIGNHRIVSLWPARGGPVIRDDTVYFAASIWPMMGTFLYALDVATGDVKWVNDNTGSQYIKQPHSAPSFAGVAPQGALVATRDHLVVPGGRSVPAVFDRNNGDLKYFEINAGGKGTGGSYVVADDSRFFVHTRLKGTREFNLETGLKTAFMPSEPVLRNNVVYSAETVDDQPIVGAWGPDNKPLWDVAADGRGDLILAGDCLYAAGEQAISVIQLPTDASPASVIQTLPVDQQIQRLFAGSDRLFAVTKSGAIFAFGSSGASVEEPITEEFTSLEPDPAASQTIASLLAQTDPEGYALWYGAADTDLVTALAAVSPFEQLAIVDADADRVNTLRRHLDSAGLYGKVTVHHADPIAFDAPQYVANVIIVGREVAAASDVQLLQELYKSVRPYGGVLQLLTDVEQQHLAEQVQKADLERAETQSTDHGLLVRRVGRLPGSADWTHQYGDVANTVKSDDERVKLPLGVLWFGGSSNMDVLPRHGHGPPEQVIGGRLFIEGMNSISARDVYTGRVLWNREFENLGTYDVYYDETYENTPLNPKYNQVHIPGASGRGTNYIVTEDRLYVIEGHLCHVLNAADGEIIQDIVLPQTDSGEQPQWGYIGVYEDVLLAGVGFANYSERNNLTFESDKKLRSSRAGFGSKSLGRAASMGLIAFDRQTGQKLWQLDARHSFWHNGIVAGGGRIYCLDRTPEMIEAALRRRGKSRADSYRIVAVDAATGEQLWEVSDNVFGTWLGYSEERDLLLQAGAAASDRLYAEVGQGMAVYRAHDGSVKWSNEAIKYAGPCMLHNDWIITNANSYTESAGAFHLTDGHQKMVPNPLTGELQPWKVTRAYGCNNIIASEHLLTFRSGAAGFYDLLGESGTGNLGGFKSGCTSNLVVANGVLNAPDYTRTCSCAYQNQTSLALIHMPDLEFWTISPAVMKHTQDNQLHEVGINIGAPGDRRDSDGVLWLEYPPVAGPSPLLSVQLNEDARLFQHHSSTVDHDHLPWVLSSGAENVRQVSVKLTLKEMRTLSNGLPVDHPDDDAEEQENGDVSLDSGDLELVEDDGIQLVGIRFNQVNLARNAVIDSAHIQFVCDEPSEDPVAFTITAEDTGHAERFSSDRHDLSSRKKTQMAVDWAPAKWKSRGDSGEAQRTVDVAPLVRAVISREDWEPGNSIVFFVSGSGNRTAFAARRKGDPTSRLIVNAEETLPPGAESAALLSYRVRLFFAAPQSSAPGVRQFDVAMQGETVLEDVTIDPANAGHVAHTISNVMIADALNLEFIPKTGAPVLSGIELQRVREP